jgi:hypothetical protein
MWFWLIIPFNCFKFHKPNAKVFKKENPQAVTFLTFILASKEIYQVVADKYQLFTSGEKNQNRRAGAETMRKYTSSIIESQVKTNRFH